MTTTENLSKPNITLTEALQKPPQPTEFSREQIELIKHTVAIGATDNELKLFLYQAWKRGLDPLTRQIYFIKRKRYNPDSEKYEEVGTIQTAIDGFRLIANRTGKLAGISRGTIRDDKGNLIGAYAEVRRADWQFPAREEVSFNEYCQRKKDGTPTGLWATMPETMIKKVAESSALRIAFPEDLSGIYTHEEMMQAEVIEMTPEPVKEPPKVKAPENKPVEALQAPMEPPKTQTNGSNPPINLEWLKESIKTLKWDLVDFARWLKDKYPKVTGSKVSDMVNSLQPEQKQELVAEIERRLKTA